MVNLKQKTGRRAIMEGRVAALSGRKDSPEPAWVRDFEGRLSFPVDGNILYKQLFNVV